MTASEFEVLRADLLGMRADVPDGMKGESL
jgi:hypothetical protein